MSLSFVRGGDALYRRIARLEQESATRHGISLVFAQLYLAPVYLVRTLCQRGVGDDAAVANQYDGRNLACLDGLIATLLHPTRLVVNPFALRQIDVTAVA